MRQRKTKGVFAFILAVVMTVSMFVSPLGEVVVKAADPQAVELRAGSIDKSHGAGKFLVYISNAEEVAANCSWYSGIYNGTNKVSSYFAGKVLVGGENYTASIWVPGDQGTSGLIRFDVNTTSNFSIPAGTVFTNTDDASTQIVFNEEYIFDVAESIIYPANMSIETMTFSNYAWGQATLGLQIGNVAELPAEWHPSSLPAEASCPKFKGEVQVTTSSGTTKKTVEMLVRGHGEAWFYLGNAGITSGTITIPKNTLFYPTANTSSAVRFPKTYVISYDNQVLTHAQETLELYAFSWTNSSTHVGVTLARQDEMQNVGWYTIGSGTTDSTYYTAYGNIVNENGETKQIPVKVANNGELFFMISGVASKTITISKDTVFKSTGSTYPYRTTMSFKFARDYVIDIANQKVINKETIALDGYDWKDRTMINVYNGNSSFNDLEWYEKNYNREADREVIKTTGIAKDHAGNDVSLTMQIQDAGKISLWYDDVQDTSITIPAGTVFKTTSVSTAAGTTLKKQYDFTFEKSHIVDPVNKYIAVAGGQWGEPGDANQDKVTNVVDLVRMKKYLRAMGDSTVTSIAGWKLGFGADVNVDGSYNVDDLDPLRTILLTGNYAANITLVGNNTSIYTIITPTTPTDEEIFAAQELQYFLKEATGVTLPIMKEMESTKGGRYIYVGDTTASKENGITPTYEEVQYNGFQIVADKQRVYIKGYSEYGTRNAVYQFLEDYFDYECYAADEIALTEKTRVEIADDYDKVVTPSFDWRHANYGELVYENGEISDTVLAKRMRYNAADEVFVTGYSYHNSFRLVRPDAWYADHPDWYYTKDGETSPTQLCYYAAANNEDLFTVLFENSKKEIKANNAPNMVIGIEDAFGWCDCAGCTASYNTYKSNSAIVIQFINKLQAAINEWYTKTYPGQEPTKIVMFSYHDIQDAPVKTGNAAKDALVTLHEDAGLMLATSSVIAKLSESYSSQAKVQEILEDWEQWTDNLYMWTYSLIMNNGLLFIDTTDFMLPDYQLWSESGAKFILDQTEHYQQHGNSGFSRLKMYLMSKLQWDCDRTEAEKNALIDGFFKNYFGEASTTMKALYEAEKLQIKEIQKDGYGIDSELLQTKYWPQATVASYLNYINRAYSDIAALKTTNPERYAQLYKRILLEGMQFRYIMLMLYPSYYGTNLEAERTQFQLDTETLKISQFNEHANEDAVIKAQLGFYLKETLPLQLSSTGFSVWSDGTIALTIGNHSALNSNTSSIYHTTSSWLYFYGDIIVDGVKVTNARFDIPPAGSHAGILAMRGQTSFTTIQIPKGTELITKSGLYKIVFDKTYTINYTNKTVTAQ